MFGFHLGSQSFWNYSAIYWICKHDPNCSVCIIIGWMYDQQH